MFRQMQMLMFAASLALAAATGQAQVIAGPITNPANGHQYFIIWITDFAEYALDAQNLGGYPVVINNAAENTWIHQNLLPAMPSFFDHAYIGLTDEGIEDDWRWVAGVQDTYTSWDGGEPNNSGNEDYASIRRESGNWNDLPAPSSDALLCALVEVNPTGSEPTGIQHGPICDPATGSIYYMLTAATFDGADQFAMNNLGGRLVTIESLEENTFITRNLLQLPNVGNFVTIGLTDRDSEGTFQWIDGSGAEFRRWWPGQPSSTGSQDYVHMWAYPAPGLGFWFGTNDVSQQSIVKVTQCPADFDRNGTVAVPDIFAFLSSWFSGCP